MSQSDEFSIVVENEQQTHEYINIENFKSSEGLKKIQYDNVKPVAIKELTADVGISRDQAEI